MSEQQQAAPLMIRGVDMELWRLARAEGVRDGLTAGQQLNVILRDWLGLEGDAMTTNVATITVTQGATFPGGNRERVYRLRAGRKGRGRILAEMGARDHGSQTQASDEAEREMRAVADRLGFTIVDED